MLQYLLNATIIWLLSLVVFDLFLRRETFHNYNRIYLLFTFLLGIVLPLVSWHTVYGPYNGTINAQVETVTTAKANIVAKAAAATHAAPTGTGISSATLFWFIYLTGVFITSLLLITDIIKLTGLYRNARKWKDGAWTIVETGKNHSPFSLFRYVFVKEKSAYSSTEWNTILTHEQQHGKALHFIDVFIMQLAKIVFWFHPLVYIYQKRLLMIHEYQADHVSAIEPKSYGAFLIEQSLLQQAPQIAHSFNRSPIKNRITMLTHASSRYRHFAKILILPMVAIFFICCTKAMNTNADQPEKNNNVGSYKSNTVKFKKSSSVDTVSYTNTVTNYQARVPVSMDEVPALLNGETIVVRDPQDTRITFSQGNLRTYILKQMQDDLAQLPDGRYKLHLNNIVVDKNGKLAYYEYAGIRKARTDEQMQQLAKLLWPANIYSVSSGRTANIDLLLDKAVSNKLDAKFYSVMASLPSFTPLQSAQSGTAAPSLYYGIEFWSYFSVKDHQMELVSLIPGC